MGIYSLEHLFQNMFQTFMSTSVHRREQMFIEGLTA